MNKLKVSRLTNSSPTMWQLADDSNVISYLEFAEDGKGFICTLNGSLTGEAIKAAVIEHEVYYIPEGGNDMTNPTHHNNTTYGQLRLGYTAWPNDLRCYVESDGYIWNEAKKSFDLYIHATNEKWVFDGGNYGFYLYAGADGETPEYVREGIDAEKHTAEFPGRNDKYIFDKEEGNVWLYDEGNDNYIYLPDAAALPELVEDKTATIYDLIWYSIHMEFVGDECHITDMDGRKWVNNGGERYTLVD